MSKPRRLLNWVSRVTHISTEGTITEFSAEHRIKVYATITPTNSYYEVFLPGGQYKFDPAFGSIDEALLYAERIIAEIDPEFYLQHAVLTNESETI